MNRNAPLPSDLARILLAFGRAYDVPRDLQQPNVPSEGIAGLAEIVGVKREWLSRILNRHQRRGGNIAAPSQRVAETLCGLAAQSPVYGPEVERIAAVDPAVAGWLRFGRRRVDDVQRLERGHAHRPAHTSREPKVGIPV